MSNTFGIRVPAYKYARQRSGRRAGKEGPPPVGKPFEKAEEPRNRKRVFIRRRADSSFLLT